MVQVDAPPVGSIYFWMYNQGLKQVAIEDIEAACSIAGINIREKDYDNYWRGYYKHEFYASDNWNRIFKFQSWIDKPASKVFQETKYSEFPSHPFKQDVKDRWVPCNKDNKPMIKWGQGCLGMTDAQCYPGQVYLAENLLGCNRIVIDCDGDHDEKLDLELIMFLWKYQSMTHTLMKPKNIDEYAGYEDTGMKIPASFHLTFKVDRVIPTMHFPEAHLDIVGNRRNSLRYLKNKRWNGLDPIEMTDEIWSNLQQFVKHRKESIGVPEGI